MQRRMVDMATNYPPCDSLALQYEHKHLEVSKLSFTNVI